MKKLLLLCLILLSNLFLFSQNELITSIIGPQAHDIISNALNYPITDLNLDSVFGHDEIYDLRYLYSYDVNKNLTGIKKEFFYEDEWQNMEEAFYAYDGDANLIKYINKRWDWDLQYWLYLDSSVFTYNDDASLSNDYHIHYGSFGPTEQLTSYTYNSGGQLIEKLSDLNLFGGTSRENYYKYRYTYDTLSNLSVILIMRWQDSIWENSRFVNYAYNSNDNLVLSKTFLWNDSSWLKETLYVYSYDINNSIIEKKYEFWDFDHWENKSLNICSYDLNLNKLSSIEQEWENNEWVNQIRCINNFSTGHAQSNTFKWDGNNWIENDHDSEISISIFGNEILYLLPSISMDFYYSKPTGIIDAESPLGELVTMFPNPASTIVGLQFHKALNYKSCEIKLVDPNGKTIDKYTHQSNSPLESFTIPLDNVSSGIYFVIITSGHDIFSKKLIVSK